MRDDSLSRVAPNLPTFDIVVATLQRTAELDMFVTSLEHQQGVRVRLLVVDQNDDDGVAGVLARHSALEVVTLTSTPGLSRARNVALPLVEADVVAFPDDDCVYPDGLLERVARILAGRPELDGVTGQAADPHGAPSGRWPTVRSPLRLDTFWNKAISHTIFLRRELIEQVGGFDEALGLGSGTPWHSGEEIDLLVRALRLGARIEYDPAIVVLHPARRQTPALGHRDGASVGYILARHDYPVRVVLRMLVRPLGGAALSLLRGDVTRARFHLTTLQGRVAGYRGGRRAALVEP